jgi:hypothetical protein
MGFCITPHLQSKGICVQIIGFQLYGGLPSQHHVIHVLFGERCCVHLARTFQQGTIELDEDLRGGNTSWWCHVRG